MFPMSWMVIFFSVEFMMVLSFFFMSYMFMVDGCLKSDFSTLLEKNYWFW